MVEEHRSASLFHTSNLPRFGGAYLFPAHAAHPGRPFGGSFQFDSCGFAVVAPVTLERVMVDARSDRLDAGEHHLATTLWARRPVDGWKPKKNKLVMEHGRLA
jgi:hypothetical protein